MKNTAAWPPLFMDVDDFLAWDGGGHQGKLELVDGVVRARGPATMTHGIIHANLCGLIHPANHPGPWRYRAAVSSAVAPRVRARLNVRLPDLGVSTFMAGPNDIFMRDPILLIEVIWPGDVAESWDNVWTYTTIPSVQEILIVHSTRIKAELLRRGSDGAWPEDPKIIEDGGTIQLASIEAGFAIAEVYRGTHLAPS